MSLKKKIVVIALDSTARLPSAYVSVKVLYSSTPSTMFAAAEI